MKRLFNLFIGVLIATSLLGGSLLFLESQKQASAQSQAKCYFAAGAASLVVADGCTLNIQSGGTLDVDSGAIGAPVVGQTSNVVSGALIAHGVGTTPTAIILTPLHSASSGLFTQTVSVSATNATSFTVNIATGSVTTITTLMWMAAK